MDSAKNNVINAVYQMIRDASSEENARAIQDSESNVALDQKRLINGLIKKGWSKNEICFEVQRVWGHDVLILPELLDDTRSLPNRLFVPGIVSLMFMPIAFYGMKRGRFSGVSINKTREAAR